MTMDPMGSERTGSGRRNVMKKPCILIVEDEAIVAEDIRITLESFGYSVCGVVSSGEEAIIHAEADRPDLVLMDIMLKGEIDGVEAAGRIRTRLQIPVVYLTAYTDDKTLERAKITEPFGYIIKPFEERELHTIIEMALYKARMEKKLRDREEWFSTTLKSIGDAVIATDSEGKVVLLNPVAEGLTGWDTEEARGRPVEEVFHIINENTRKPVESPVTRVLREGVVVGLANHTSLISRNGKEICIDDSGAPIRDSSGNIMGVVMVFRDITEKKNLQARLEQAQRMEAIGTLAGGIAHDFNNFLQGLRGYVSIMLSDMDADHPHYEKLKCMDEQIEHCAMLTAQLLGFARGGRYRVESCDINLLVRRNLEMFSHTHREIMVRSEFSDGLWFAEVDRGQIEQVLMNLFVNASQAMPGGGELRVETANRILNRDEAGLYGVEPGKYVRITIADNGTGMDEETRKRIFEPFFTTKEMGRGTGLGLASAYGIIRNHQGAIDVKSKPGSGSIFEIYLPATDKTPVAVGDLPAGEDMEKGRGTVLLVDDEDVLLQVGKEMLTLMGYEVLLAPNGKEALRIFETERENIDLVVLDMVMPGISGKDVYDRMIRIRPDLKVLFSSGYALEGEAAELVGNGRNDFIQKPFSMKEFSDRVRRLINQGADGGAVGL